MKDWKWIICGLSQGSVPDFIWSNWGKLWKTCYDSLWYGHNLTWTPPEYTTLLCQLMCKIGEVTKCVGISIQFCVRISCRDGLFLLYMWLGQVLFQEAVFWKGLHIVSFHFVFISSCVIIISSCSMLHDLQVDKYILSSSYVRGLEF